MRNLSLFIRRGVHIILCHVYVARPKLRFNHLDWFCQLGNAAADLRADLQIRVARLLVEIDTGQRVPDVAAFQNARNARACLAKYHSPRVPAHRPPR